MVFKVKGVFGYQDEEVWFVCHSPKGSTKQIVHVFNERSMYKIFVIRLCMYLQKDFQIHACWLTKNCIVNFGEKTVTRAKHHKTFLPVSHQKERWLFLSTGIGITLDDKVRFNYFRSFFGEISFWILSSFKLLSIDIIVSIYIESISEL